MNDRLLGHLQEQAYHIALTAIAQGATRAETKAALMPETRLTLSQIDRELANALRDAIASGVEIEDIDRTWWPHCTTTLSCYVTSTGAVHHSIGCESS